MAWKPDIWKAKKLHDKNAKKAEKLKKGFKQLRSRANRLDARYSEALRRHFDEEIAPFAELFARIKNVDLEEVQITRAVPEMRSMRPEALRVSLGAVKGMVSIAGGAAAGVGASALTFAAVGAFAAASTGTAIASLSGAAATSATLAWLGGGSLAAGGLGVAGGTAVLTGIVVLPAVLAAGWWIWWQGGKELDRKSVV